MNITRKEALKKSLVLALGFSLGAQKQLWSIPPAIANHSKRPAAPLRKFRSKVIDDVIKEISSFMSDKELANLFENCFPNTLDTTVFYDESNGEPDTFVITGDIKAMWLRDSSAQVWPYLPFLNQDDDLKKMVKGLIRRQVKCVQIDPYANAFNKGKEGSHWKSDLTEMKPELHERKWEIDSLCYVIRLSYGYWKETGDASLFDGWWQTSMHYIVKTFKEQQRFNDNGTYSFQRKTEVSTDTVPLSGFGNPTRKIGLIHSMFRPSDDACMYPFLIPSNLFAERSLRQLAEIYSVALHLDDKAEEFLLFADELKHLIAQYGIVEHRKYGKIYAYEVDGYGNYVMMDDANVPSLLSLPYLNCCKIDDGIYLNTRNFVWSEGNPYFFRGTAAEGIGGPHVGADMIWPMSIIMKALTTEQDAEIYACLQMLKSTHAGTGFMHESFHKNNPEKYSRSWFAWANTLFGELIVKIYNERKELLKKV